MTFFKATIVSFLFLFAAGALADTVYSTPAASNEVLVSGAPGSVAQVCYTPATSPGPSPDVAVVCDGVELFGAMDPVSIYVADGTPVRVQGARWAYTRSLDGVITPMQGYKP
jgi:hypothetical protein